MGIHNRGPGDGLDIPEGLVPDQSSMARWFYVEFMVAVA
jgi:hypothetical protein